MCVLFVVGHKHLRIVLRKGCKFILTVDNYIYLENLRRCRVIKEFYVFYYVKKSQQVAAENIK